MDGVELAGRGVEIAGQVAMLGGMGVAVAQWGLQVARRVSTEAAAEVLRRRIGRAILLGLEFLVAGDILRTVAIAPTLESLAVLAGIVLVRTFLSFTIQLETEGRWPWQARTAAMAYHRYADRDIDRDERA